MNQWKFEVQELPCSTVSRKQIKKKRCFQEQKMALALVRHARVAMHFIAPTSILKLTTDDRVGAEVDFHGCCFGRPFLPGFTKLLLRCYPSRDQFFPMKSRLSSDMVKSVIQQPTLFTSSFAEFVGIFVTMQLRRMRRIQL